MNKKLDLACIVPVYNEALVIEESITKLVASLGKLPYADWQIVIASNGSTDETDSIVQRLGKEFSPHVRLVTCRPKGRGRAVREAFQQVTAKRYLCIDIDLPCRLSDLPKLIKDLDKGIDVVTSRRTGYRPRVRRLMTLGLRQMNRYLFGISIADSQCAIKALSPRAAEILVRDCQQNGWYLDTELVVLAANQDLRQSEHPIHWIEKRFSNRPSKVRPWADSLQALRALIQIRRHRSQLNKALAYPHPVNK